MSNATSFELPPIVQIIQLNADEYAKHVKTVQNATRDLEKQTTSSFQKMQTAGDSMSSIGKKLTIGVTAPLTLLGKSAYESYKSFDTAFRGVIKTTDLTTEELNTMRQAIRDMAKELPHTVEEISAVAEAAGQLGIKKENILDFTEVMLNLGVSTNLSATEAATSIARFANITGMAQTDVDRLGAVVVDLGNNFATTEAEIMQMGLRLAGAGAQIGLTEPDILALAASLSSVGIEAQAGGSAFSRLMSNIQVLVATGSPALEDFARVSGQSADDFARHWREDPAKALLTFVEGLGTANERGEDAIVILDELGINELRLRDSVLRAAGAKEIFTEAIEHGSRAWEENTALTKEADLFNDSVASNEKKRANERRDAMLELGEAVAPIFETVQNVMVDIANAFNSLDEGTQEAIVKMGLFAIALGPILTVGGGVVSTIGKVGSALAGLKATSATAATAIGGAKVATAGLSGSLAGVLAAAAPVALGVGALGVAAWGLHEGLTADVIPTVDLFTASMDYASQSTDSWAGTAYGASQQLGQASVVIDQETKNQLGSFMELHEGTLNEMNNMYIGLNEVNSTNIGNITSSVDEMAGDIIASYGEAKRESLAEYRSLFTESTTLTHEQMADILSEVDSKHQERINKTRELQTELNEIYAGIKDGSIDLTADTQSRINELMQQMKEESVTAMSQNEAEQGVILNRLASHTEGVTAQMVANTVKELNNQRDESIRLANEERDERVRIAENLRNELPPHMKHLADDLIEDANRTAKENIEAFEDLRNNGLYKLKDAYGDMVYEIDLDSGEMKNSMSGLANALTGNWDTIQRKWDSLKLTDKKTTITTEYRTIGNPNAHTGNIAPSGVQTYYSHYNGIDSVPYDGYMIRAHKGEKLLTAREASEHTTNNSPQFTIENFINNREQDIQQLIDEFDFYMKQKNFGKG